MELKFLGSQLLPPVFTSISQDGEKASEQEAQHRSLASTIDVSLSGLRPLFGLGGGQRHFGGLQRHPGQAQLRQLGRPLVFSSRQHLRRRRTVQT